MPSKQIKQIKLPPIAVKTLVEQTVNITPDIKLRLLNKEATIRAFKQAENNIVVYFNIILTIDAEHYPLAMAFEDSIDYDEGDDYQDHIEARIEDLLIDWYATTNGKTKDVVFGAHKVPRNEFAVMLDVDFNAESKVVIRGKKLVRVAATVTFNCYENMLEFGLAFMQRLFPADFKHIKFVEKRNWYKRKITVPAINEKLQALATLGWEPHIQNGKLVFVCRSRVSSKGIKQSTSAILAPMDFTLI